MFSSSSQQVLESLNSKKTIELLVCKSYAGHKKLFSGTYIAFANTQKPYQYRYILPFCSLPTGSRFLNPKIHFIVCKKPLTRFKVYFGGMLTKAQGISENLIPCIISWWIRKYMWNDNTQPQIWWQFRTELASKSRQTFDNYQSTGPFHALNMSPPNPNSCSCRTKIWALSLCA